MKNQTNILHQLTANLSFKNVEKTANTNGSKLLLKSPVNNNLNEDCDSNKNGKRRAEESSDEDENITILSGIKQVAKKKAKKAKNLDQINRERVNKSIFCRSFILSL